MEVKRSSCETCPYRLESDKEHPDYSVYYCTGKDKNSRRRLKKKDRGAFPPDWCPRYINPPKLRIYSPIGNRHTLDRFDKSTWYIPNPSPQQYTLRLETDSPISAFNLYESITGLLEWRSVHLEEICELVGTEVEDEDVLVLDDGILPISFYLDTRLDNVLKVIQFNVQQLRR